MITIFKQERGVNALKKLQSQSYSCGKVRTIGGIKFRNKKAQEKLARVDSNSKLGDSRKIAEKISKFTPGRASANSAAKRSTHRLNSGKLHEMPSPGAGSQAGTTNHQSMEEFKKMVAFYNKRRNMSKAANSSGQKEGTRSATKSGKRSVKKVKKI